MNYHSLRRESSFISFATDRQTAAVEARLRDNRGSGCRNGCPSLPDGGPQEIERPERGVSGINCRGPTMFDGLILLIFVLGYGACAALVLRMYRTADVLIVLALSSAGSMLLTSVGSAFAHVL
jgi:hypothetical protein